MLKNDKLDALIIMSGDVLIKKNYELYQNTDVSGVIKPKSLDRRVMRNINRENRKKEYGNLYKYFGRCAVLILVVCTVSFAVMMSVEAVRSAVWNAIIEFFDDYLSISYVMDSEVPDKIEQKSEPEIERPEWEKQVVADNNCMYVVVYRENGEKIITYMQRVIDENNTLFDNENTEIQNIKIGEMSAVLMFRTDMQTYSLSWSDGRYEYSLEAHSSEITKEDLISFAKTLR